MTLLCGEKMALVFVLHLFHITNHSHWTVYDTKLAARTLLSLLSVLQLLKVPINVPVSITLSKLLFALCEVVRMSTAH